MTKSKRIGQVQVAGDKGVQNCKILRFHTERIRVAQESMPSNNKITELSNFHSAMKTTWQQKIILALEKGALCTCDIAYVIGLSIPATLHQLKHLHKQKLISYKNSGKMVYYSLRAEDMSKAS